jgi:membrane protein DedA with SNARE-associated domain
MSHLQPDSESLPTAPLTAAHKPAPTWLLWAAGSVVLATGFGAALAPYLLVHHPLWLLALNPWPRHQILVAPHSELAPFLVTVTVRSLFTCWVSYELGKHYGVRGTALLEGRAPDFGRSLRTMEHWFGRFSGVLLVVMPGWLTSALGGMAGVTRLTTLSLSGLGVLAWAAINHHLGGWLEPWTRPMMQFLREHMLAACLVCAASVLLYQLYVRRKRSALPPERE